MIRPTSRTNARGRLSGDRTAEVYAAVLDELVASGYERLSLDAVARAAKCSKATLYRQWDGKFGLVRDALKRRRSDEGAGIAHIDHGNLRDDLHAWAREAVDEINEFAPVLVSVIRAAQELTELGEAVRDHLAAEDRADATMLVRRAVERGEIPDGAAVALLDTMLLGPTLSHPLLTGRSLTADDLVAYVDAVVLPALGLPTT